MNQGEGGTNTKIEGEPTRNAIVGRRLPTVVRRSQSYAPSQFNSLLQRERPAWARDLKRSRQDGTTEEASSPSARPRTDTTLKRRRVEDVERLKNQSSDLQVRMERFRWVAREAAAKAQSLNASSTTLRVRSRAQPMHSFAHTASASSSVMSIPERSWPVSHSLRVPGSCIIRSASPASPLRSRIASPSPRRKPQQPAQEIVLSLPPLSPQPVPDLRKTESKHNLSLGDFIAAIPEDQRRNSLSIKRANVATPLSEKEKVSAGRTAVVSPSPFKGEPEQKSDTASAQTEAVSESMNVDIQSQLALNGHNQAKDYAEMVALAAGAVEEHTEAVIAEEDEAQVKRKHRINKQDEALLKREGIRRDFVSKRAKGKPQASAAPELEELSKGKKRKSSFLTILKGKSKKQRTAEKERDKANEAIDQEKLRERVEYIKRKIEERYGVVRRTSKRTGRRVRIQDPTSAALSASSSSSSTSIVQTTRREPEESSTAQPQVAEPTDATRSPRSSKQDPIVSDEHQTITASGTMLVGGRRRRAITLDELANANTISIPKKTLVKQDGFILLGKENMPNCAQYQYSPAKSPVKRRDALSPIKPKTEKEHEVAEVRAAASNERRPDRQGIAGGDFGPPHLLRRR